MFRRDPARQARRLAAQGAAQLDSDRGAAERCYLEAVRLDPGLHVAWFDLGLIYKWTRQWKAALDCNLRAAELRGEVADEPAWWNLGIAATALHRWDIARRAWRAYGVAIPEAAGPIEADFGYCPVRLNPDGEPEVVWGRRIDPARMRLTSVPFPSSDHRWADIVLHDGAPSGYREVDGEERPVFDELMRWAPSDVPTVEAFVSANHIEDVDQLLATIEHAGFAAEDWTRNVRMLCKRCSEGAVHAEHTDDRLQSGEEHLIGIGGSLPEITAIVHEWAQAPGRQCHSLDLAN